MYLHQIKYCYLVTELSQLHPSTFSPSR